MAKKIDCSELSKEITEIASNLMSRDNVRNLDDVLKEMHKFPELQPIRMEDLENAIVEASEGKARTLDDAAKKISAMKRQARKNKGLRELSKALSGLEKGVKGVGKKAQAIPRKPREATPASTLKLQAEVAALESKVNGSELSGDLSRLAQQIAKELVANGVTDRNAVVDAVHAELSQAVPDLTKRQVSDAISGYGQFKRLSKDEVSVKLRDIKGQLQQLSKLEDMAAGQAPSKTGIERREPSDEERRLIQQVNEAKRRGGFTTTDPEAQLKTALDAIKTRLRNQIADLQHQIKTRTKIVKEKTPPKRDAETLELMRQRDELAKQFADIFGKPGLTDAQRIENAKKSLEKSIEEYERRLNEQDYSDRKKPSKTPDTPELQRLREKRDQLREKYQNQNPFSPQIRAALDRLAVLKQHLRDGTIPDVQPQRVTRNPVQRSLQEQIAAVRRALSQSDPAIRKRFEKSINELTRRLEEDDFTSAGKREDMPLSKELERLQYERDELRRKVRRRIESMKPKSVWQHIAEPFNASRAVITSIDFSAVLRQGGFIGIGNPARAAKSIVPMFRAFGSERVAHDINRKIRERPNAPLYAKAKLYLADMDGDYKLNKKEEAYMSRWAEKIPLVRGSERAYVTFLNKLRADSFDAMVATLGRNGEVTLEEARAIANFVNVATGRGNLGSWDSATGPAAQIFFSPRLLASRFQIIFGQPAFRGSMRTRKAVAKEYGKFLIGIGLIYALGYWAGGDIEKDPRSSDFGKIRFGNTRIDVLGGISQVTVLLGRLATGELKSTRTGEVYELRGEGHKFGMPSTSSVLTNFLRSKLSPIVGTSWNVLAKENVIGETTDITTREGAKRVATDMMIPLSLRDIYEAMLDQGVPKGTALGLLSIFGFGLQSYEQDDSKKKSG